MQLPWDTFIKATVAIAGGNVNDQGHIFCHKGDGYQDNGNEWSEVPVLKDRESGIGQDKMIFARLFATMKPTSSEPIEGYQYEKEHCVNQSQRVGHLLMLPIQSNVLNPSHGMILTSLCTP